MCLYGLGLLPILPIGFMVSSPRPYKHIANLVPHQFMVEPQFHHSSEVLRILVKHFYVNGLNFEDI